MKFIIIGLGNFGASLATKLTRSGHEVFGVDSSMNKVELLKQLITHTICLDCTDTVAVRQLPLDSADAVVVCIGEDEGANLMATALMKRSGARRLISRAVNELHETVLEAMGVETIIHPEEETAERWALRLDLVGIENLFEVAGDHQIVEARVPDRFIGRTVMDIGPRKNFNVVLLTTIRAAEERNLIGARHQVLRAQGVATSKTVLEEGDIMVLYGHVDDIRKLLKEAG